MAQTAAPTPSLFAPITAFGQNLANNGIFLKLGYIEDLSSLVAGGQKTGTMPIGQLYAGVVFDLQTIMGISGASIHIGLDERNGRSIDTIAGNPSGLLQSDAGPFRTRLSYFYWEQGFDHDRLDVILGRVNPTEDFAVSDISCSFVGILCSQPTSWYFNNADVPYPSAAWGSRVNFLLTPDIYLRAGVYLHDSTAGEFQNAGFNWNFEHTQGAFLPVEIGYQTNFNNARYPAKYDLGFYEDTASYAQPNGQPGERHAVWAQFEQAVWRPDRATNQSLSVFGGALVYSGNSPNWGEYYLGVLDRGPFAARPHDTIGLVADVIANNSAVRPNKPTQETFELNYGISVAPGLTVKPYTQYVIAPTNADSPLGSSQPKDAWVVGVQVVINVAELLHLPQFVAH
jgi:carbohydrate-selective porin OprB